MDWVAEKQFRTGELSLNYRMRLAATAAALRQAALNGESTDEDRVLSIADALECTAFNSRGESPFREQGCHLWG